MNTMDQLNLTAINPALTENSMPVTDAAQAKKEQFAKDFESVFIEKLLEEMKNTIGDWGYEQDAASKQVQGLFWLHLARDVSQKGGLGMWKDIYQSLNNPESKTDNSTNLDNRL